jgi:hypothetical protein
MRHGKRVVLKSRGHDGRAHAGLFRAVHGCLVNRRVGGLDGLHERCRFKGLARLAPGFRRAPLGKRIEQGMGHPVDGHGARDFTGEMSAHAIGEYGDAALRDDQKAVLVVLTHHAGICFSGHLQSVHAAPAFFFCDFPSRHLRNAWQNSSPVW